MPKATREQQREYQREWLRSRRTAWITSRGGACERCGSTEDLEVDHIEPSSKSMNPTMIWSRAAHIREAELAKCQVLCGPCHKSKTKAAVLVQYEHGEYLMYTERKCRCVPCKNAWRNYYQSYRARKAG